MKEIIVLCLFPSLVFAQFNLNLIGHFPSSGGNDCWGYVDDNGTEYAFLGTEYDTRILSLADPTNPNLIRIIDGPATIWRDIKIWDKFAFVSIDQSYPSYFQIIDLSDIENGNITHVDYIPQVIISTDTFNIFDAHNIFIDETGYLYMAGSSFNSGGVIIFDVFSNPGQIEYVSLAPANYAHDVFVRGDTMWTSDLTDGNFSIYDVSDKQNITFLGSQETPDRFTHQAWLSDDGQTLFALDEKFNSYTVAYDVSDPTDIKELDRYRPFPFDSTDIVPHNAFVDGNFLVVAHYSEGVIVLDITRPHNLVKVAQYDTYTGVLEGYHGCWGAYPYLPSGLVLASDTEFGLFVLQPSYQQACFLEGQITDAQTSLPIQGAKIRFANDPPIEESDISGTYATGIASAGTYQVTVSKPGYYPTSASVTLTNGQVTIHDFNLSSHPLSTQNTSMFNRLEAYPNPGSGQFNIYYDLKNTIPNLRFQVYNSLGKLILEETFKNLRSGSFNIELNQSGYYIAKFVADGGLNQHIKLIVNN